MLNAAINAAKIICKIICKLVYKIVYKIIYKIIYTTVSRYRLMIEPLTLLFIIGLVGLIIGTITDIKKHEVPDWVSYGMIAAGLGIRVIMAFSELSWNPILSGIFGLAVFAAVGNLMFYLGQWGGGDGKVLMGLGAIIGIYSFSVEQFAVSFIINLILAGGIYGIIYAIILGIKNPKNVKRDFSDFLKKTPINIKVFAGIVIIATASGFLFLPFLQAIILLIAALIIIMLLVVFHAYSKAVEKAAMIQDVPPSRLTEGDWIAKNVYWKGKLICGPKDLGISKEQIEKLIRLEQAGKIRKVRVKVGIPFMPAFLAAFIMSFWIGNVLFIFF